jgi:hypothetical protein
MEKIAFKLVEGGDLQSKFIKVNEQTIEEFIGSPIF